MAKQPNAYKKFVATAATATLVATALAPVASAAPVDSYKDVSKDYKDAVNYLLENSIAQGTSDTTFGTSNNISRGDAAVMIANALKLDTANAKDQGFQDVNSRVEGAVNAIVEAGIASGRTTAKFDPAAYITRQEMAKMLANAYKLTATEKAGFKDVNKNWIDYVSALKENGITLGKSETIFAPEQNLTRGEFALFVFRAENPDPELAIVEAVTVVNETTTTATLKTANKELTAKDFTVLVNGKEVTPTKVESDAKGEVYTITHASLKDSSGTVSVNGKQTAFNFVVVEPKVESVKAINANQIEVKFNQKMTKASAEFAATSAGVITVKEAGTASALSVASKLSADGKTATLTLDGGAVLKNDTGYDVTVGTGVLNEKGEGLKEASTTTLQFSDKVKPTVVSVVSDSGNVVVNFSEKLKATATTVVINGQSHTVTPAAGDKKITVAKSAFTGVKALEAGKSYTVVVAGAEDLVGNAMDLYSGSVQYSVITDTVAPTVSAVTAEDEKTFTIKFSEVLSYTDGAPTAAELGLTVNKADGSAVVPSSVSTDDGMTFEVELPTVYSGSSNTEKITVNLNGYKDAALNLGQAKSTQLTMTKDTVAPKLVKSEYNPTTDKITLTFDEGLATASAGAAGTFEPVLSIVNDATGKTVTVPAGSVEAVAAGSKTVVIDNAVALLSNGNYTFHVAAGAVTDTAITPNTSSAFTTKVAISGSASVKPTLTSAAASATNLVTVTYGTTKVKGGNVAGSATDASNYKLNGAALPAGSLLTIDAANQVVSIQLPAGSVENTSTQILTVSGVQALGSTAVMDSVNTTVSLTDTKKPEISSAVINTSGDLVLTFSENVQGTGTGSTTVVGTQPVIGDFIVAVDGSTVATGLTVANGATNNQLVIKSANVSLATGTVTVKATGATTTGKDAAGNNLSTVKTVTATR